MSEALQFLQAVSRAFGIVGLYDPEHPRVAAAIADAAAQMATLLATVPTPTYTFTEDEILFRGRVLPGSFGLDVGTRLRAAGIQRIELGGDATAAELKQLLTDVVGRTRLAESGESVGGDQAQGGIRYGAAQATPSVTPPTGSATIPGEAPRDYGAEIAAVRALFDQAREHGTVSSATAEGVTWSLALSLGIFGDATTSSNVSVTLPLLAHEQAEGYRVRHAINVAILTMMLAREMSLPASDVRAFGSAALLSDIGAAWMPPHLVGPRGRLVDEDRTWIQWHPIEGAGVLMASARPLPLAAVVAYEHHLRPDGLGYPTLLQPREPHVASRIVHVCDVFDALRAPQEWRPAWPVPKILELIEDGRGTEFEANVATAFCEMVRVAAWAPTTAEPEVPSP